MPKRRKSRKTIKKKQRKTRKQKGGVRLGEGLEGIVFWPPPCRDSRSQDKTLIGKLMTTGAAAKEQAKMYALQARLAGTDPEYFLLENVGICEPDPENPDIMSETLDGKQLLLYKHGGTPLFEYVETLTVKNERTPEAMNSQFKHFMFNLGGLFHGAEILIQRGIVHSDIKNDNLVVGGKEGKVGLIRLIDFGDSFFVENTMEKNETSFHYPIWPPEVCVSLSKRGLQNLRYTSIPLTKHSIFHNTDGVLSRDEYCAILGLTPDQVFSSMVEGIANILEIDDIHKLIETEPIPAEVQRKIRMACVQKLDVFSIGYTIYRILNNVLKEADWFRSPDVAKACEEIMSICKAMMNPNVARRMSISEAKDMLLRTSLFEVPAGGAIGKP